LALIVCDTDFLIKISNDPLPRVRLGELSKDYKFVIIPSVIRELSGLEKHANPRTARRARMVDRVIRESKRFKLSLFKGDEKNSTLEADDALIEFVKRNPKERILATLDGSLLSRFERTGLPYLTLSKGKLFFRPSQGATYLTKRAK
jgi:rRNA-processing protein FCF1